METKSLGFIGGGRVTKIFLQALANKEFDLSTIIVCDTNDEVLIALKKQFPAIQTTDSLNLTAKQNIVFIALHPPVIMETLESIKEVVFENTQIVSLAPKISIEKIIAKLGVKSIARMIPNATSYINEGYNPICFSEEYAAIEKKEISNMLTLLGNTFEVDESKLEAFAMISAMLPTYFWFQWKEIQKIGEQMGLNQLESKKAIQDTLIAAINLYFDSELSDNEVIDLIPVKPIGEHESQISEIYQSKLMGLFQKIKP